MFARPLAKVSLPQCVYRSSGDTRRNKALNSTPPPMVKPVLLLSTPLPLVMKAGRSERPVMYRNEAPASAYGRMENPGVFGPNLYLSSTGNSQESAFTTELAMDETADPGPERSVLLYRASPSMDNPKGSRNSII